MFNLISSMAETYYKDASKDQIMYLQRKVSQASLTDEIY